MALTVAIALIASIAWGLADFSGGWFTRRNSIAVVALVSQVGAFTLLLMVGVVHGLPTSHLGRVVILGCLAGITLAASVLSLYGALARGTMSIVAPLSGLSALIPIFVGLAQGDAMTFVEGAGILAVLLGMPMALMEDGSGRVVGRKASWLVAAAILSVGCTLALAGTASRYDAVWGAVLSRAVACCILGVIAVIVLGRRGPSGTRQRRVRAGWTTPALLLTIGAVDGFAFLCFSIASHRGLLSVVAALGSLYPLTTVGFAQLLLRERLRLRQWLGIGTVLAGVVLVVVAAPSSLSAA